MMKARGTYALPVLVAIFLFALIAVSSAQQESGTQISIEHALGAGAPFTPRGQLSLPQTAATAAYGSRNLPRLTQQDLSPSELRALKELAAKGGRYQVRLRLPFVKDTRRQVDFVTASVPACALLESNLGDDFRLTLDQFGNIIGVDYRTATAECGATPADATRSKFDTKVSLGLGVEAAKPIRQELETPEIAKEKAEGEKGFIASYWMYILPVFLAVVFMGGGGQEPEGAAAQGGDGAPATAAAGRGAPARRGRR